jgi:hypothetical protein
MPHMTNSAFLWCSNYNGPKGRQVGESHSLDPPTRRTEASGFEKVHYHKRNKDWYLPSCQLVFYASQMCCGLTNTYVCGNEVNCTKRWYQSAPPKEKHQEATEDEAVYCPRPLSPRLPWIPARIAVVGLPRLGCQS